MLFRSGTPVTNVFGQLVAPITTGPDGRFLFDNLPLGRYKVTIVTPPGFRSTVAGASNAADDSAIGFDMSLDLTVDGASDMTLDFGFVEAADVTSPNEVVIPRTGTELESSLDRALGVLVFGLVVMAVGRRRIRLTSTRFTKP